MNPIRKATTDTTARTMNVTDIPSMVESITDPSEPDATNSINPVDKAIPKAPARVLSALIREVASALISAETELIPYAVTGII